MNEILARPQTVRPYDLPLQADIDLARHAERFLYHEAHLLDGYKLLDWMELITPDIDYRMPIRNIIDNMDIDAAFSDRAFHMVEDYESLAARMVRFQSGLAWSEKPPSRVRRHVSNIRVDPPNGDDLQVQSYLLFHWGRDEMSEILSAERRDVLRMIDGRLYLARRLVLLDHVSIPIPNLSVVL